MNKSAFKWEKLFWFCFGLFLASLFCMKWIEDGFVSNSRSFSIMDLELNFDKPTLQATLAGLNDKAKAITGFHLYFDFFFMAGVFPGIASLCMLAREKVTVKNLRFILFLLAALQFVAWGFDISENINLIKWLHNPEAVDGLAFFHLLVRLKFIIAITGILAAITAFLFFRKKSTN